MFGKFSFVKNSSHPLHRALTTFKATKSIAHSSMRKLHSTQPQVHPWPLSIPTIERGLTILMGPDPTRAYLWPAVNKRPNHLWPDPKRLFLTRRGKKIETFAIFRGNFPNPNRNHKWLTWPDLSQKKLSGPRSKNFDPDPSLWQTLSDIDP